MFLGRVLHVLRFLALDLELRRGDCGDPHCCLPVCNTSSSPDGTLCVGRMEVAQPNHPNPAMISVLLSARGGAIHLPKCLDHRLGAVCTLRSSTHEDAAQQSSTQVGLDGAPGGERRLVAECAWYAQEVAIDFLFWRN